MDDEIRDNEEMSEKDEQTLEGNVPDDAEGKEADG